MIYLQLLFLIIVANGAPIIARWVLEDYWAMPLDRGRVFFTDGRPVLGPSKTVRGVLCAILLTPVVAVLVGLSWDNGLLVAVLAMLGDCVSSFLKRRLGLPSSTMALGIDQIPESLFPLLGMWNFFPLDWVGILTTVVGFFILELGLSAILYKLHIRKHPY